MSRPSSSLVGFMPESEAIQYFQNICISPDNNNPQVLSQRWQEARQRIKPIAGTPGLPEIREIPVEYLPYLERVAYFPGFADVVRGFDATWKLVEIDPLICFQHHVVDDVCESMVPEADEPPSFQALLDLCLPVGVQEVPCRISTKPNSIVVASRDSNLVIRGMVQANHGPFEKVSGFTWSGTFNQVMVTRFEGRCYLRNGYHRAVALRRRGITHMPCVMLETSRWSDVVNNAPGQFTAAQLLSEMPPTVGHLTGETAYPVRLREYMKVITISVDEAMVSIDI